MKALWSLTALLSVTLSGFVQGHERYEYARVTEVVPVYQQQPVRVTQRSCTSRPSEYYDSTTPTIVGAIVGGALGHALGNNKSNKRVGLVAGAALGGSIGHDISRTERHVSDCRPSHNSVHYQQVLQGYQVTYKHRGRYYQTFTEQHPGRTIPLLVSARPVHRYN